MDSVNKWLTLAANGGVIAGIVFLGIEMQQNNSLLEAQAGYNLFQNRISDMELAQSSHEFALLMQKLSDNEELTRVEEIQSRNYHTKFMVNFQWEWGEFQAGRLDLSQLPIPVWSALTRNEVAGSPSPDFMEIWEEFKIYLEPEFVQFMEDEVIKQ